MGLVVPTKKVNKVKKVVLLKSAVFKSHQIFQVGRLVMQNKIMRRIIHSFHQFIALLDDGCSVSPGKNRGKKSGNLNIAGLAEPMWHANRIVENEGSGVVLFCLLQQKVGKISR